MSDEETKILLTQIRDAQRLAAKATAELAMGLGYAATREQNRHSELQGMLLGMRSELHAAAPRRRRDSIEDTKKFKLPGFEETDQIQLSRRTQRKIIRWVILAAVTILINIGQFIYHHQIAHTLRLPDVDGHH